MAEPYATIREVLCAFIGETLVEVTQQDREDFLPGAPAEVFLHFGNGQTLHFWVGEDGFDILDSDDEEPSDG
jgi:hypothetical protein